MSPGEASGDGAHGAWYGDGKRLKQHGELLKADPLAERELLTGWPRKAFYPTNSLPPLPRAH